MNGDFLDSGGMDNKRNKKRERQGKDENGRNGLKTIVFSTKCHATGNEEDTSSLAEKIHDVERQMLHGKLVLVGDDGEPLKLLNIDGQTNSMESFPCFLDTFGTPNTSTKMATACPNNNLLNKGDYSSIKATDGVKLTRNGVVSNMNLLNGEPSKRIVNFRTLVAPTCNRADVAISLK